MERDPQLVRAGLVNELKELKKIADAPCRLPWLSAPVFCFGPGRAFYFGILRYRLRKREKRVSQTRTRAHAQHQIK